MLMKFFRVFVVTLALTAMIPNHIFAQNDNKIECYDTDCVFKILKHMASQDEAMVADAENSITQLVDNYKLSHDRRIGKALKNAIIPYVEKFDYSKSTQFLISQLSEICEPDDTFELFKLADNERFADCAIRAIGDIKGSGEHIEKYVIKHPDVLNYKAAMAYAIGKQCVTSFENELISWLDGADDKTKIEIYNALLVIKSNEKTERIIEKGAKKLYKSKILENKIAGMRILTALIGENAMPMLNKALKNKNGDIRREALELMKPFVNQEVVKNVMKRCKKDDALVDALNWLGEIKSDSQMEIVIKSLSSDNRKVVEAAIRAVFKIDNPEGIESVKPMFSGEYQIVIKESMLEYKGDYAKVLEDVMKGNDNQKLAALQIIEARPVVAMNKCVFNLLGAKNPVVRDKAYDVMKYVAIQSNALVFNDLLETCDEKYVEDLQLAFKKATETLPDYKKNELASVHKHLKPDFMVRFYKMFAYWGTEYTVDKLIDAYQSGEYKTEAKEALLLVENEALKAKILEALKD